MKRIHAIAVTVAAFVMTANSTYAQVSPEEAQQRLEARRIAATQPAAIATRLADENRLLKLQIAQLDIQINALKKELAKATEPKVVQQVDSVEQMNAALKVGMSKGDVEKFAQLTAEGSTEQGQIYRHVISLPIVQNAAEVSVIYLLTFQSNRLVGWDTVRQAIPYRGAGAPVFAGHDGR